jgi:hypothetical protein
MAVDDAVEIVYTLQVRLCLLYRYYNSLGDQQQMSDV